MIEVVTLSSKGQLVVPKGIREEMGLTKNDKFVLVNDRDTILIKKIKEEEVKARMRSLMKSISEDFKKAGITEEDLRKEIKAVRSRK